MAFNISTFISNLGRDGLRPNLFEIQLPMDGSGNPTSIALKAKATALPASSIGVAPLFYFGRQAKFAGNRVFADWTVSIIMDEYDFFVGGAKGYLERWSSHLNSHVRNVRSGSYVAPMNNGEPGYMRDGYVNQLAKDGSSIVGRYKMVGCYPIDIGAIPVDWGANDQIAEFSVTFAMQWWQSYAITENIQ